MLPSQLCPIASSPHPIPHTRPQRVMRRNTYALKVRGNAMCDCNLFDGDVIIIRRLQAGTNEETAVAEINQREVALKKLSIDRFGVHLLPADSLLPAVFLHNRDIQVLGLVMGVNRQPTEH
ncbi:S24 family peptidase [Halomonas sp. Bachu 37]|uniref:LexA family protein n=1 Tax=Halomonas kashgarensis TaxID=3084920 RepID=UPI003216343C